MRGTEQPSEPHSQQGYGYRIGEKAESTNQDNPYLLSGQKQTAGPGNYQNFTESASSEENTYDKLEEPIVGAAENTINLEAEEEVYSENDEEKEIIDLNNEIFDSFIGVNKLPLDSIDIGDYLAEGSFGQVYRGGWGNRLVALKKIDLAFASRKLGIPDYEAGEALRWEVSRLSTTSHPNLVQFYGVYQHENEGHTYLVMEFWVKLQVEVKSELRV